MTRFAAARKPQTTNRLVSFTCFVVIFVETFRLFTTSSSSNACYSLGLFEEPAGVNSGQPGIPNANNEVGSSTMARDLGTSKKTAAADEEEEAPKSTDSDEEENDNFNPTSEALAEDQLQTGNTATIENPTINDLSITSVNHIHDFRKNLEKNAEFSGHFCVPWHTNADEWWTHNPVWEMGAENDTHYCFQEIQNEKKRQRYLDLYSVQFHGNCSQTHTKRMWNSGWSADFANVVDGLRHAVKRKRPVQIVEAKPWHFAYPARKPTKDNRQVPPACPRKNMFCYFLPLSNCPAADTGSRSQFLENKFSGTWDFQTFYEYATRRQTWLRKRIYDFAKQQNVEGPCTAIHVRRGDVVLHTGKLQRRYHPIAEYMEASDKIHKNVYLLTDDKNAINEAEVEFPKTNWMYLDRPRYRAAEGGWEKQIPSNDPTYEVTALLTEFQLARKCDQLIHSRSGFATQLYWEMKSTGREIKKIDLDERGRRSGPVHSENHKFSTNISLAYGDSVLAANSITME